MFQICYIHNLPFEQFCPKKPEGQVQSWEVPFLAHVPPYLHGFSKQRSVTTNVVPYLLIQYQEKDNLQAKKRYYPSFAILNSAGFCFIRVVSVESVSIFPIITMG